MLSIHAIEYNIGPTSDYVAPTLQGLGSPGGGSVAIVLAPLILGLAFAGAVFVNKGSLGGARRGKRWTKNRKRRR